MRGVLTPAVELEKFGSLGGLQVPNFGSVSFIFTLGQSGVVTLTLEHLWLIFEHGLDSAKKFLEKLFFIRFGLALCEI